MPEAKRIQCGERLREARKAAGMSQRALAAEINISQAQISRWEREGWVTAHRLPEVAEALGVSADFIAGAEESEGATYVSSLDELLAWKDAVVQADLPFEEISLLMALSHQSLIDQRHWVVSTNPEHLAGAVRKSPEWVRELWPCLEESVYVKRIGGGEYTYELVFPE